MISLISGAIKDINNETAQEIANSLQLPIADIFKEEIKHVLIFQN